LEVGGALRLRLEARISTQLTAGSRQHKDRRQRIEGGGDAVSCPLKEKHRAWGMEKDSRQQAEDRN